MNNLLKLIPSVTNKELLSFTVAFLVYFVISKISLYVYITFETHPALIWPPIGIAVALMILGGYRMWIPIFLAQFIALATEVPGLANVSLIIAISYSLQAVAALYVFKRFSFGSELGKVRDTMILILTALFVTAVQPVITTLYQVYNDSLYDSAFNTLTSSWGAGIFSVLVFTSAIIAWYPWKNSYVPKDLRFRIEVALAFTLLIAVNYLIFWSTYAQDLGITVIFIVPAVLIWFALRFHPRWLTAAVLVTALQSVAGAIIVHPSDNPLNEQLLSIQIYVGLIAAIFYVFAAVVEERRQAYYKLEEAYRLTSAADQAKNDFIAILAHELRNPLAPIKSSLELLDAQQLEPESKIVVAGALDHTRMMKRLLDDLLDMARLSQNKIKLRKETVSLEQMITQSVASVSEFAKSRQQKIEVDLPEEEVLLYVDSTRIKQVVINLLNNACKYMNPGGTVRLYSRCTGDSCIITVSDSGVGIDKDMLGHIFEPFKQLDDQSDQYTSGLGIGLFLTKRLVELHQGTLSVSSEGAGKGSVFTVRLPHDAAVVTQTPSKAPVQKVTSTKILIVDDNEAAANILQKLLKLNGHDVEVAYSGKGALEKVAENNPQIVFLDIGMPDMDGYEVATRLRATTWSGKIIALSGYGQDSDRAKTRSAGFDHHLVKPVGIKEINSLLASIQQPKDA